MDELLKPRQRPRSQPVTLVLAGRNASQRSAVKAVLDQIQELDLRITEVEDSHSAPREEVAGPAVSMVILDDKDRANWPREIQSYRASGRHPRLVAVVRCDDSADLWRAALSAGADDVLNMPPIPQEALRSLLRSVELWNRREAPSKRLVCSLTTVSGGTGVSSLAVNIALGTQRLLQKRTALVDLDLQAASLGTMLDLDAPHNISELADPTSTIDSIRLESVLCKHESGLYLLSAPKRIEEAELVSVATVESVITVLHELCDAVIIDCGGHLSESSVAAWERSDRVIYVLDQTVTSIRSAQRFLDLYGRLNIREMEPSFVLNRYVHKHPITVEQIESALQHPIFAKVPRDDKAFIEMQVSGADAWKVRSSSPLRESLEALVHKLFGADENATDGQAASVLTRLLGTLGLRKGAHNGTTGQA